MNSNRVRFAALVPILLLLLPLAGVAQIHGDGVLLIASKKMTDPRFVKAVILVTRHGRSPPLGVIINRPLDISVTDAIPELLGDELPQSPDSSKSLYFGGPVSPNLLVFLFRSPEPPPSDAIAVGKDIFLGRAAETLDELLRGTRSHIGLKVFSGYSGWANGQLEKEIERGDWLVQTIDRDYLFDKDVEIIWPELYRRATQPTTQAPDFYPRNLQPLTTLAQF